MSSPFWTPAALSSEFRRYEGLCWRLVEAQHVVSTLKIVDGLAEQDVLENLIEATKPVIPPECRHLHHPLATPFRYGSVYPTGSRFRRAGRTRGVYYAAESVRTAVAGMAFYRLLFFVESPGTPFPVNAAEFTAFSAPIATSDLIDLTLPPPTGDAARWTDPVDTAACQALADAARAACGESIRYASVRDPAGGMIVAVLTGTAFSLPRPVDFHTWNSGSARSAFKPFASSRANAWNSNAKTLAATRDLPRCLRVDGFEERLSKLTGGKIWVKWLQNRCILEAKCLSISRSRTRPTTWFDA